MLINGKQFRFFNTDGDGGGNVPPVIAPVIDTGNELVAPVIDHTEKIANIESRQQRHEEDLMRQIGELESRLAEASTSQANAIYERIAKLEEKLEAAAAKPVEETVEGAEGAVDLTLPEVEASPVPPEKVRQGLRARRKAKRGKK